MESEPKKGLGDFIEKLVKPIAVAIDSSCLDENHQLIPGSRCHQWREWLNQKTAPPEVDK